MESALQSPSSPEFLHKDFVWSISPYLLRRFSDHELLIAQGFGSLSCSLLFLPAGLVRGSLCWLRCLLFARACGRAVRVDNSDSFEVCWKLHVFANKAAGLTSSEHRVLVDVCAEDGQTKVPGEWEVGTAGTIFPVEVILRLLCLGLSVILHRELLQPLRLLQPRGLSTPADVT